MTPVDLANAPDFSALLATVREIGGATAASLPPTPLDAPDDFDLWDLFPPEADAAPQQPLAEEAAEVEVGLDVNWSQLFDMTPPTPPTKYAMLPPLPPSCGDEVDTASSDSAEGGWGSDMMPMSTDRRGSWQSDIGRTSDDSYTSDSSGDCATAVPTAARRGAASPPATRLRSSQPAGTSAGFQRAGTAELSVAAIRRARRERYSTGARKVQPRRFDLLVETITAGETRLLAAVGVAVPIVVPCGRNAEAHVRSELRKIRNKASAQRSRGNKEILIVTLENENDALAAANETLAARTGGLETTVASLQSQLSDLRAAISAQLSDATGAARGVAAAGLAAACAAAAPMSVVGGADACGFAPTGFQSRGLLGVEVDGGNAGAAGSGWAIAAQAALLCVFLVAGFLLAPVLGLPGGGEPAAEPRSPRRHGPGRAGAAESAVGEEADEEEEEADGRAAAMLPAASSWDRLAGLLATSPTSAAAGSVADCERGRAGHHNASRARAVAGLDYLPAAGTRIAARGAGRPFVPFAADRGHPNPYGRELDASGSLVR